MSKIHFHGWFSLFLMAIIISIGLVSVLLKSVQSAFLYMVAVIAGVVLILFGFCSKCPCRDTTCRHIVFGPVAGTFFKRPENAYSFTDIALTSIGISLIVIYPQFWLIKTPFLMITFWVTAIALVVEITMNICKTCDNIFCPGYVKRN